jgi:hypothetical protein
MYPGKLISMRQVTDDQCVKEQNYQIYEVCALAVFNAFVVVKNKWLIV